MGLDYDKFFLLERPGKLLNPDKPSFWGSGDVPFTSFYSDPFMGYFDKDYEERMMGRLTLTEAKEELRAAKDSMGEYAYIFDELEKHTAFMEIKTELGVRTRAAYRANDKEKVRALLVDYDEALVRLDDYYKARRFTDMKEYKSFGMEIMDIHIGGLKQRIESCKDRLVAWLNGEIPNIEEMDEDLLAVNRESFYELYHNMISRR